MSAVHCGGPGDRGWWALLYVAAARGERAHKSKSKSESESESESEHDHTQIRVSSDSRLILEHVRLSRAHWKHKTAAAADVNADADDDDAAASTGGENWYLALMIGAFSDETSARLFCATWAERCRGTISRVVRGETLSSALGLRIYGDFRTILSDARAYDYISVVEK